MNPAVDVVVAGAGPAGLVAAMDLARTGRRVLVLEAADHVGGMAASHVVAGQRVDLGSHRLHPSCRPDLLMLLRDLLGPDLQTRPRHGRIRLAGRWLRFPLGPTDLLTGLPPAAAARAARDLVALTVSGALARVRPPAPAANFAEAVRARLGTTVSELFYAPYARKLWGAEPEDLDAELARRRIGARSASAVVAGAFRRQRPTFLYPRRGYGQIVEALADAAVAAGATIECGAPLTGVRLGPDGVTVHAGSGHIIDAATLVATVPAGALTGAVGPDVPPAVVTAARSLELRGMLLVYLPQPRRQWTPFDAHYFPGPDTVVSRVSEPRNYRDSNEEPADCSVVCAEIPCTPGDDLWAASDATLAARVAGELAAQGLPALATEGVVVHRRPNVYPVFRRGYANRLAVVDEWLASQTRLLALGRQGRFVPDNLHHVMAMGRDGADAIRSDGTVDRVAWDAALARVATNVVDD